VRQIVVGEGAQARIFRLSDPDAPSEAEFECRVANVLCCIYPEYRCGLFSGGFRLEGDVYRPDLALVACDFSHWFIIEVELIAHSFNRHVLPQVKAFRYGDPLPDCSSQLSRMLDIGRAHAETIIQCVPRSVVVVANSRDHSWQLQLRAHDVQLLTVSMLYNSAGDEALELDGELSVFRESLGFGTYFATDRSLRFLRSIRLPDGDIQINDPLGAISCWHVRRDHQFAWITKSVGLPAIPNQTFVQLLRTFDGRLSLRRPGVV